MGEVYENAKLVQVWLGPKVDESDLALALIRQIQDPS